MRKFTGFFVNEWDFDVSENNLSEIGFIKTHTAEGIGKGDVLLYGSRTKTIVPDISSGFSVYGDSSYPTITPDGLHGLKFASASLRMSMRAMASGAKVVVMGPDAIAFATIIGAKPTLSSIYGSSHTGCIVDGSIAITFTPYHQAIYIPTYIDGFVPVVESRTGVHLASSYNNLLMIFVRFPSHVNSKLIKKWIE